MKQEQLLQLLEEKFGALITLLENLPEGQLATPTAPGKWSIGQHSMHLMLSSRPVAKAMALSKEMLTEKFGVRTGDERSTEELTSLYHRALMSGLTSPPRFVPEPVEEAQKRELIDLVRQEMNDLTGAARQWSEADLSQYQLPHPALGNLSMREMLLFTALHTDHHLAQMR